jgi:hypothetical protein
MKTLVALLCLTFFLPKTFQTTSDPDNKIGVWKTYDDYAKGKLTDLGEVTENHNSWKDKGVFFDKEHIMPETTQYFGARIPHCHLKPHSFVYHDIPEPGTSLPVRFINGKEYTFILDPKPIGVFTLGAFRAVFDDHDDIQQITVDGPIFILATKGSSEPIEVVDKQTCRNMFADDPAILKMYDNDEVEFKGRTTQKTKDVTTFMKYARKYNRKHGAVSVEKSFFLPKEKAGK